MRGLGEDNIVFHEVIHELGTHLGDRVDIDNFLKELNPELVAKIHERSAIIMEQNAKDYNQAESHNHKVGYYGILNEWITQDVGINTITIGKPEGISDSEIWRTATLMQIGVYENGVFITNINYDNAKPKTIFIQSLLVALGRGNLDIGTPKLVEVLKQKSPYVINIEQNVYKELYLHGIKLTTTGFILIKPIGEERIEFEDLKSGNTKITKIIIARVGEDICMSIEQGINNSNFFKLSGSDIEKPIS